MIRVKYSCKHCGLTRIEIEVPDRGPENVIAWMQATMQLISVDHRRQSPGCAGGVCDLMIPHSGSAQQRVGSPTTH